MSDGERFKCRYQNGRLVQHFLVDVTSAGPLYLANVFAIAFSDVPVFDYDHSFVRRDHATHVLIEGRRQITFLRALGGGDLRHPWDAKERFEAATAFAEPIRAEAAARMAWDWLQTAAYGDDENDGATYRGWRVFNDEHGIVDGHWEAFLAVRPMWIYLSK